MKNRAKVIVAVGADSLRFRLLELLDDGQFVVLGTYQNAAEISLGSTDIENGRNAADLIFVDRPILEELESQRVTADFPPIVFLEQETAPAENPKTDSICGCEGDELVFGFLSPGFGRSELLNVVTTVARNRSEILWLRQQCGSMKNLLNQLRTVGDKELSGSLASLPAPERSTAGTADQLLQKNGVVQTKPLTADEWERSASLLPLESIPHAVQEVDPTGRILFSNAAHGQMHGFEPGELVGRTIWELLASEKEQASFRAALEDRMRNAPPPLSYTTKHRHRNGEIFDVQVDWTYRRDRNGDVESFISIITDITQQVRDRREFQLARQQSETREVTLTTQLLKADESLQHESERRRSIEKAMRHSRRLASLGVFAAGIAHEINNPISAGLSSAETALSLLGDRPDSHLAECLVNVIHATRRCRTIVRDLLKFSRQQPTEKRLFSLNFVVRRAIEIVQKVNSDHPVPIEMDLAEENLSVELNLLEIEIAIANLIHNSIEAVHGNSNGRVRVSTRLGDGAALLQVCDNGCGISKKIIEHIFDPFFTTRRGAGGTGLGLSIVYAIVRNHRGEISIRSIEDSGTTFEIQFPLVSAEGPIEDESEVSVE